MVRAGSGAVLRRSVQRRRPSIHADDGPAARGLRRDYGERHPFHLGARRGSTCGRRQALDGAPPLDSGERLSGGRDAAG